MRRNIDTRSKNMRLVLDGIEGWSYKPVHGVRLSGGVPVPSAVGLIKKADDKAKNDSALIISY